MDELKQVQEDIREIAGYVQTLAKAVLRKEEHDDAEAIVDDELEKDFGMDDDFGGDDVLADDPMDDFGGDDDNEYMDMMEEPDGADWGTGDFEAAYKAIKMLQKRQAKKGYAASAKTKVDEHDAPFGEKDSDTGKGNEAIPAGTQGGDRGDETFGPGGMAYSAMKKQLSETNTLLRKVAAAQDGGQIIAKAVSPSGSGNQREEQDSNLLTREMQEDYKKLTFKQINAHREEVGDLPRNLITGV